MPDIQKDLEAILAAKYGRDVRGSIHDAIRDINEVVDGNVGTVTALTNRAETAAATAETSAQSVQGIEKLSESYAKGGTGTRAGEDTDNAKYYAEQASKFVGDNFIPKTEKGAPNGVATLGSDGKVPTAQLPTIVTDAEHITYNDSNVKVALDNRYTKTETNALLYGENLLRNSDFRINQRGQTEYSAAGYILDRWRIETGYSGIIKPTDNGISIRNYAHSLYTGLYQNFDFNFVKNILGKTVTVSVCHSNGVIDTVTGVTSENKPINIFIGTIVTVDLEFYQGRGWIRFIVYGDTTFNVEWIKLELGSIATPYIHPDYTTELVKCLGYYQKWTGRVVSNLYTTVNATYIYMPLVTTMRATPTISNLTISEGSNPVVQNVTPNGFSVHSGTGFVVITSYEADAEIY